MKNIKRTLALSATVDDRRPVPPTFATEDAVLAAEHRKLDSVLRATHVAVVQPPEDLADRILMALETTPHRRETVLAVLFRSPGRLAALAAACVAVSAGVWMLLPVLTPSVDRLATAHVQGNEFDATVVFGLPARSEPAIRASIDNSFMQEAASLRSDTVRAADMVLAHLPIGKR